MDKSELLSDLILSRRAERVPERVLADGRKVWLYPMMFTTRLAIGPADADGFDDSWCYETLEAGQTAFDEWDPLDPATPEPMGWVRHPTTGRRRPEGDASREYVNQ